MSGATGQNPTKLEQLRLLLNRDHLKSDTSDTPVLERAQKWVLHFNAQHLHGPEEVDYAEDELVVLCLLRNGRPYVRSFVEHYTSLGAKHLVFMDNGSTDGTVEALQGYDNVTVLRSTLPFKRYQFSMKRYLIERFGRGRWSLLVDMDELFDYPYSDVVGLDSFLRYLRRNSYTAVLAQMLDMFPDKPLSDAASDEDEPLKEVHRFYDISNVRTQEYGKYRPVNGDNNVLANEDIEIYRDGIQNTVFNANPPLTKHPLVFLDEKLKPMDISVHGVSNAHVADITCVLFHYKFLDRLYELVREAVRQENYMRDSKKHKKWIEVLEKTPSLLVKGETAREIGSVNDLVENQFLVVSEDYMTLVYGEEQKNVDHAPLDGSGGLDEAFFRARAEAKAQSLRARRLKQRLEDLKSSLTRERQRSRRTQRRVGKLQKENGNLMARMQGIQASKSWRLVDGLNRIRVRILGRK